MKATFQPNQSFVDLSKINEKTTEQLTKLTGRNYGVIIRIESLSKSKK